MPSLSRQVCFVAAGVFIFMQSACNGQVGHLGDGPTDGDSSVATRPDGAARDATARDLDSSARPNSDADAGDAGRSADGTVGEGSRTVCTVGMGAFPEAQGGGAASVGGRGGVVIEVTNLDDAGPGSLRTCVDASGPRICVFRVAGTIELSSGLDIANPYLTIAGQTAPGGGILLSGKTMTQNMLILETHDVVIRYIRIRKGLNGGCEGECGSNQTTWGESYNIVLDHLSLSWNQDEGMGVWGSREVMKDFTISYNLIAEGLAPHPTSVLTGGGPEYASQMVNIDIHHSLMMNNSHRNPFLGNKSTRFVNNINYNHRSHAMQLMGGIGVDVIGSIFRLGPMSDVYNTYHEIQALDDIGIAAAPGSPSIYLLGNVGWSLSDAAGDQWLLAREVTSYNGPDIREVPAAWRRSSPLADTNCPITAEPVGGLEASLLPVVGASRRLSCDGAWIDNRDSVDGRLIDQYRTNTGIGALIADEAEVGGFPVIAPGTACDDADHDGMPDVWESARGLNPHDPADRNDLASNGYTNIENYLNGA